MWRGATTGMPSAPGEWRSLERIRLCELAQRYSQSGLIDAGISSVIQFHDPQVVQEIRSSGLLRDPIPWANWGQYKYLIDIDGNSSPWSNLFQKLLTGSAVLKVESSRSLQQWFYDDLIPWKNYVPIAPDMSDLMSKISWLVKNDSEAERIGRAATRVRIEALLKAVIQATSELFRSSAHPNRTRRSHRGRTCRVPLTSRWQSGRVPLPTSLRGVVLYANRARVAS